MKAEIQSIEDEARTSRIGKRDLAKFESANHRPRRGQSVGLGADRGLHFKKREQVSEEQSLIRDPGEGRENLLNVATGLKNGVG